METDVEFTQTETLIVFDQHVLIFQRFGFFLLLMSFQLFLLFCVKRDRSGVNISFAVSGTYQSTELSYAYARLGL